MAQFEKLNNNALADLDEVKRFMGITDDRDDVDDELTALINRVSKAMETYCNRSFYTEERTEYHRGDNNEKLFTLEFPITSVSGVWVSTDRTWDDDTLVANTDYFVDNDGRGITFYNNHFSRSTYENIRVIYTAGLFATTEAVPADLKLACLKEVNRAYKLKDDTGLKSRSTDEGGAGGIDTLSFINSEFLPETVAVLNRYLNRRII